MARLRGLIAALGPGVASTFSGGVPDALTPVANKPVIVHSVDVLARAGLDIVDIAAPAEHVDLFVAEASRYGPSGVRLREMVLHQADGQKTILEWIAGSPQDPCIVLESTAVGSDDLMPHLIAVEEGVIDAVVLECPGSQRLKRGATEQIPDGAFSGEPLELGFVLGTAVLEHLGSEPREASIGESLGRFADNGGNVSRALLRNWCKLTGSASALLMGNRLKLDELVGVDAGDSFPDSLIEGRVKIHDSASVRSSRLRGPLAIGPGARIADSYVGPYTSIGAGCQVEGSEIENSILMTGSQVHYFGYRIEESVVGRRSILRSDFRMPKGFSFVIGAACEVNASP